MKYERAEEEGRQSAANLYIFSLSTERYFFLPTTIVISSSSSATMIFASNIIAHHHLAPDPITQ